MRRRHDLNSRKSLHVGNSFIIITHFHPRKRHQLLFIVRIINVSLRKYYSTHNNYMIIYPKQKTKKIGQNLLAALSSSWPAAAGGLLNWNSILCNPGTSNRRLRQYNTDLIFAESKAQNCYKAALTGGLMQKINFPQVPAFGSWKMLWNIAN